MNAINEDLLHAVQTGKVDDVKSTLENKGNPNSVEQDGYTLLHWASQEGFVEIAKLLIEFGANPNAVDETGLTPLFNSAGMGDLQMVKVLVEGGADVNLPLKFGSALHNAAAWKNFEVVEFLLNAEANANMVDEEGQTPLFFAVTHENAELLNLLIQHGADKNHKDKYGNSALDVARNKRDEAVALYQVMEGALV